MKIEKIIVENFRILKDFEVELEDDLTLVLGHSSTNSSLRYFFRECNPKKLIKLTDNEIQFEYKETEWKADANGKLRLAFQKTENDYTASSFEDAFFSINSAFINEKKDKFIGLKNRNRITVENKDYYSMALECVNSKPAFALDILLHSDESLSNWATPLYIKEGLEWLAK